MDASDIYRLLTSEHYAPADLEQVEDICNRYPYFSLAHVLKARIREVLGYDNDREVKKAAVYVSDRSRLREMVTGWRKQEEREDEVVQHENEIQFSENPSEEAEIIIEQHAPYATENQEADLLELDQDAEPETFILETEKDHNKLIKNFIREDPGPIRADQQTRLSGDVSLQSIREHDGFITDTLAQIYVKQGLYAKAIYAYEKLSLKYPEKSAYFAAQIEKITNINH